ncbi:hypothetical protein [Cellulomonas bogoriensis]|uniref:hypothetical protein n=1 Tax=Cellulomonas bogoriensis TaxID=301388 RepID=UPI0012EB4A82|nr:hypothetical protein [Cellulomonas bogoriensis]
MSDEDDVDPGLELDDEFDDEFEEDSEEEATHPYSWLHVIVLVLVAFVLGMLIYMVLLNDDGAPSSAGGAPAPTTYSEHVRD